MLWETDSSSAVRGATRAFAVTGARADATWRSIPSCYLLGVEDRAIPPAGQRFMAERGNARIEEVTASHASMVAHPEVVTRLISGAVEDQPQSAVRAATAFTQRRATPLTQGMITDGRVA